MKEENNNAQGSGQVEGGTGSNYNPLKEEVEHKPQQSYKVESSLLETDIPEPHIDLSKISSEEDIFSNKDNINNSTNGQQQQQQTPSKKPNAFNPGLTELTDNQKKRSAEYLAKRILHGYQRLHDWGNSLMKISDRKIIQWQTSGEVDLSIPVPYTVSEWMPMGEFIKEYNQQAGETFILTQEFKDEVEPVLIEVLAKYGHGLTPEQFLAAALIEDSSFKIFKGIQMKAVTRTIIDFAKEQTANFKKGNSSQQTGQESRVNDEVSQANGRSNGSAPTPQPVQQNTELQNEIKPDSQVQPTAQGSGEGIIANDIQSQAISDLVINPGGGTVQQKVPEFGDKTHLKEVERKSKQNRKNVRKKS